MKRARFHKRKKTHVIFSQQEINNVMSELPFVEIIKEFVVLRKKGSDYAGRCPLCKPHTANNSHFRVSERKRLYKCFECGAGGTNAVSFIMRYWAIPFDRALTYLNKEYTKKNIEGTARHARCRDEGLNLPF